MDCILVLLLHSAEWFGFKGRKDIAPPVTNRKTKREEHCNSISGLSSKKKWLVGFKQIIKWSIFKELKSYSTVKIFCFFWLACSHVLGSQEKKTKKDCKLI